MAKSSLRFMIACIALFMASCNSASTDNKSADTKDAIAFDPAKAKSAIETENAKFIDALRKGDSAGMAANYAQDAWLLPPNSETVKGNGISALWGSFLRMGVKDLKLSTDDISGNAEQIAETGSYEIYGDKNKFLEKGKYVVVWKSENRTWKMYRDIWNSSMPAEATK